MNSLRHIEYNRKSSESKEKQALSIAEQHDECQKYAHKQGLNVVLTLQESKSAFKPRIRPEFDKMIALIESGQADAILTWHLNRLCRNPEEGGKILQLLQDGIIKEIRTASGEIYTPDSDHLILQIHFGMSNQYSRNISKDVRRALGHKAERGEYPRPAPIGFETYGERGNKNLRPHPFEASLIKEAFSLVAKGMYSLGYLEKEFYKKGLRTKRGRKISKSHWYSVLTNPVYYGFFYHNKEFYKGTYEPILNKALFETVQVALQDRSKPKKIIWDNIYNGLVRCPTCNCSITTSVKIKYYKRTQRKVTYKYLHCTRRKGNCNQKPIPLNEFESQLLDSVSKISLDEEVWTLGVKLLKEKHKHEVEQNNNQRTHLQIRYNAYQDRLNRLIEMRADGEITKEEFLSQKEILLKEQEKVKSLLDAEEQNIHGWLELAEDFLNTAFYARDLIKNGEPDQKRNLIMSIGENFFLRDKKLEFSFKKPYDILLKPEYRTNVLALINFVRTYYREIPGIYQNFLSI